MKLVIIAGGKGTRLGISEIPKPMVLLNEKPLLEHQILLAKRYGIQDVYILSGHLSHVIIDYFGDGAKWNVKINHIVEQQQLGTAGALKQLEGLLSERFMVFYGDTIMDIDLPSFMQFDAEQKNSIGSIVVHPNDHPYDSDLLEVDENRKVVKFHSKPHESNLFYANLVNAALYIFSPDIFKHIEENISLDFGKDIFPQIIETEKLYAYKTAEYLKDMGTPDRLKKVEKDLLSGKVSNLNKSLPQKAIFLDRDGVINEEVDNLRNIENFSLLEGVSSAITLINKSNFISIVVTNQPGIAKGFISALELQEIHKKMDEQLGQDGAFVDDLYYCPHHPEKGFAGEVENLKVDCDCRKPKSGMFFKASNDYHIDLNNSWMIGDRYVDIVAGSRAGCRTVLVKTGYAGSDKSKFEGVEPDFKFNSLKEAVVFILNQDLNNGYN